MPCSSFREALGETKLACSEKAPQTLDALEDIYSHVGKHASQDSGVFIDIFIAY
jgi:hypothetical protein